MASVQLPYSADSAINTPQAGRGRIFLDNSGNPKVRLANGNVLTLETSGSSGPALSGVGAPGDFTPPPANGGTTAILFVNTQAGNQIYALLENGNSVPVSGGQEELTFNTATGVTAGDAGKIAMLNNAGEALPYAYYTHPAYAQSGKISLSSWSAAGVGAIESTVQVTVYDNMLKEATNPLLVASIQHPFYSADDLFSIRLVHNADYGAHYDTGTVSDRTVFVEYETSLGALDMDAIGDDIISAFSANPHDLVTVAKTDGQPSYFTLEFTVNPSNTAGIVGEQGNDIQIKLYNTVALADIPAYKISSLSFTEAPTGGDTIDLLIDVAGGDSYLIASYDSSTNDNNVTPEAVLAGLQADAEDEDTHGERRYRWAIKYLGSGTGAHLLYPLHFAGLGNDAAVNFSMVNSAETTTVYWTVEAASLLSINNLSGFNLLNNPIKTVNFSGGTGGTKADRLLITDGPTNTTSTIIAGDTVAASNNLATVASSIATYITNNVANWNATSNGNAITLTRTTTGYESSTSTFTHRYNNDKVIEAVVSTTGGDSAQVPGFVPLGVIKSVDESNGTCVIDTSLQINTTYETIDGGGFLAGMGGSLIAGSPVMPTDGGTGVVSPYEFQAYAESTLNIYVPPIHNNENTSTNSAGIQYHYGVQAAVFGLLLNDCSGDGQEANVRTDRNTPEIVSIANAFVGLFD